MKSLRFFIAVSSCDLLRSKSQPDTLFEWIFWNNIFKKAHMLLCSKYLDVECLLKIILSLFVRIQLQNAGSIYLTWGSLCIFLSTEDWPNLRKFWDWRFEDPIPAFKFWRPEGNITFAIFSFQVWRFEDSTPWIWRFKICFYVLEAHNLLNINGQKWNTTNLGTCKWNKSYFAVLCIVCSKELYFFLDADWKTLVIAIYFLFAYIHNISFL